MDDPVPIAKTNREIVDTDLYRFGGRHFSRPAFVPQTTSPRHEVLGIREVFPAQLVDHA
jgi:hypothetical protein